MKTTLVPGLTTTREFAVDRERTIDFMGEEARVYATPMLVRDIEVTCRELLLAHLDPGEDSVGTRVEIDHLAAFGHLHNARRHARLRRRLAQVRAVKEHAPARAQDARERAQERRLARPVAADEGDELARTHFEVHAFEGRDAAVGAFERAHF